MVAAAVLHWSATELDLLASYPSLASEYPSHAAHLDAIETALRELSASGTTNLGTVSGTVPSYEAGKTYGECHGVEG